VLAEAGPGSPERAAGLSLPRWPSLGSQAQAPQAAAAARRCAGSIRDMSSGLAYGGRSVNMRRRGSANRSPSRSRLRARRA